MKDRKFVGICSKIIFDMLLGLDVVFVTRGEKKEGGWRDEVRCIKTFQWGLEILYLIWLSLNTIMEKIYRDDSRQLNQCSV